MADRIISHHRTKKGVFVAYAAKPRRSFLYRALRPGTRILDADRYARNTAPLCFERNPFFA